MAFVKIDKGLRRLRSDIPEVRMGAYRGKQGRVVYLSVSLEAIEKAGWTMNERGESKRKTITVMVNEGIGDDAGFWLLTEDPEYGYVLGADHKESGALVTSILVSRFKHYLLNNEDHVPVTTVESTVDEKEHTILVQMPDWIRYNPQSYTEPPKLVLTPPKEDKKPSRPTIRVVVDEEKEEDEPPLNRKQRRLAASVLTKAMR